MSSVGEGEWDTSITSGTNHVKGVVHLPAERGEEGIEELGVKLLSFVVAGQQDPAVLVEVVDKTLHRVGCIRAHRGKRIGVRCCKSRRGGRRVQSSSPLRPMSANRTMTACFILANESDVRFIGSRLRSTASALGWAGRTWPRRGIVAGRRLRASARARCRERSTLSRRLGRVPRPWR